MAHTLALTMGDPAGIGGELSIRAWRALRGSGPRFVLLDDPARLSAIARALGIELAVELVDRPDASRFDDALPVLPVALAAPSQPGKPDPANAPAVIASIRRAGELALAGAVAGVVTNPISKQTLYAAGFAHPGHTEFLGEICGVAEPPVMMLAGPDLRVVPVTIHLALRAALDCLDSGMIVRAARTTEAALRRDFAIARPRLAVAGLNPHAGEGGALGGEDIAIIALAVAELRRLGIDASGPHPPDTMFSTRARAKYDVAICMYHDQALIPLKTLDVDHGVNITLGLPIVRTSPDHGTGFDIAGRGEADPTSLIAAIEMAARMAQARMIQARMTQGRAEART